MGDRLFTQADVELIRWTAQRFPRLSRSELANTVCENLPWKAPNGQPRIYACLPLLDEWAAIGVIHLPPKGERVSRRRLSVDRKQKKLVGNFKNASREWHPAE